MRTARRSAVLAVPVAGRCVVWQRARRLMERSRDDAGLRAVSVGRLARLDTLALGRVMVRAERRAAKRTLFQGVGT